MCAAERRVRPSFYRAPGGEAAHRAASGEAFGLRGGPLGLASGGRRLIHHVAEEEGV